MKKILNIILLYSFICLGFSATKISLFNFNDVVFDKADKNAAVLSNKISDNFIDLMKHDMTFFDEANFIETKKLNKELIKVRKLLLAQLKKELEASIVDVIPRNKIKKIVNNVSEGNLNELQLESLTDSLIVLVSSILQAFRIYEL